MTALRLALLAALGLILSAGTASAEDCTYTDLLEQFQVTVDCNGLKDHSNIGNEQKRIWLAGDWGQLNIIEVPSPYKQDASLLDFIMGNLGREYTPRRSPGGIQTTSVGGLDARVVTEHKMRNSTRHWVFHFNGRNLIMRAVAYTGSRKDRTANLDSIGQAMTASFAAYTPTADEAEKPRVRDRKAETPTDTAPADGDAKECTKCPEGECSCDHAKGDHANGENATEECTKCPEGECSCDHADKGEKAAEECAKCPEGECSCDHGDKGADEGAN